MSLSGSHDSSETVADERHRFRKQVIQTIVSKKEVLLAGTPSEQHLIRQTQGGRSVPALRLGRAPTELRNRPALLIAGSPFRYR